MTAMGGFRRYRIIKNISRRSCVVRLRVHASRRPEALQKRALHKSPTVQTNNATLTIVEISINIWNN